MEIHFEGAGAEPFARVLRKFGDNLADATPAFEAMAEYQVGTVNKRQFDEQGSVETGKWAPLSPPYARFKARVRPGRPILVFDGDLRREMTVPGKGVYEVWPKGMTVGTDIDYAKYHQKGTPNMPARPLMGKAREADKRRFEKILQRWIVESRVSV
jgi:phage gpG-like protein